MPARSISKCDARKELYGLCANDITMPLFRTILLACVFYLCASCAFGAKVVVVIIDQVSPYDGLGPIAATLAADGKVARALMIARTGQRPLEMTMGDGCVTMNAGAQQRISEPLSLFLRDGKVLDLSMMNPDAPQAWLNEFGVLGDRLQEHGIRTGAIGSVEALAFIMNSKGQADVVDARLLTASERGLHRASTLFAASDILVIDATAMWQTDEDGALTWLARFFRTLPSRTRQFLCSPNPPQVEGVHYPASWALLLEAPRRNMTLFSPSTRRDGLIVNTDIAATILDWFGVDERVGFGRAVSARGMMTFSEIRALNDALEQRARLRTPIFLRYVNTLSITFTLLALLMLVGLHGTHHRGVVNLAMMLATVISASWLLFSLTGILPTSVRSLLLEFSLGALLALLLGVFFRRRRVLLYWIATALAVILCYQFSRDWHLYNTVSYLVLNAARYYGLGNPQAGLVTAGALSLCVLGMRWRHPWSWLSFTIPWIAAAWIFSGYGAANFGMGIATAVMAFALTIVRLPAAVRLRWTFILLCSILVALVGIIWYDLASGRGSHVSQLLLAISRQGYQPLVDVITRKAIIAFRLLRGSSFAIVLEASCIALIVLLLKGRSLLHGNAEAALLLAGGITGIVAALLLNDSGVEASGILAICTVTGMIEIYVQRERNHDCDSAATSAAASESSYM